MRLRDEALLKYIYEEIVDNPKITEKYLASKYSITERTVRRYIKVLKDRDYIFVKSSGIKKQWIATKFE